MEASRTLPQDVHQCPLVLLKEPILDQIRVVVTPFQDGKQGHTCNCRPVSDYSQIGGEILQPWMTNFKRGNIRTKVYFKRGNIKTEDLFLEGKY